MTLALALHTAAVALVAQAGAALARPAALRRDLLTFGAVVALALPLVGLALPELPVLPQAVPTQVPAGATLALGATLQEPPSTAAAAALPAWPALFAWTWAAGAIALLVRLGHGLSITWRWRREATAPDEAWQAAAEVVGLEVLAHPRLDTPAVLPGLVPHVLVPSDVDWSSERRVRALRHEAAHAAARDDLRRVTAQLLCAVHWALPPVWWLRRQLVAAQEQAADAAVVAAGADPVTYAADLVQTGRSLRHAVPMAALGTHPLEQRVRALLRPAPRWSRTARGVIAVAVSSSVLGVAAVATAEPDPRATPAGVDLDEMVDRELARIEHAWAPEGASIVVVDVQSGTVAARAELHPGDATTPRTAGSVVKPFVAAAALERGTAPSLDHLGHLLERSDNDGFVAIARATTGLASELRARGLSRAQGDDAVHLALGQFPATTVELARAYAQLPAQAHGDAVVDLLVDVVEGSEGTGRRAAVPGMTVAGKTGTSLLEPGDPERVLASFVGLVPAESPRWAIAVQVAAPHDGGWGGKVAAPSFAAVAGHLSTP